MKEQLKDILKIEQDDDRIICYLERKTNNSNNIYDCAEIGLDFFGSLDKEAKTIFVKTYIVPLYNSMISLKEKIKQLVTENCKNNKNFVMEDEFEVLFARLDRIVKFYQSK